MRLKSLIASRFRTFFIALAVLSGLMPASVTLAQGTSGAFPDPISTQELEKYTDLLAMSDQQRQGIGLFHDEYLETFQVLRDGPIEDYLQKFGSRMGFMFSTQGDEKEIQESIKAREDLMGRIGTLDNRLFDRIQTVLTEDQSARLPRVKQARERTRYRAGLSRMSMFGNPGARVDLSEIVDEIDLSRQTEIEIDPLVAQYERSLTNELRKLYEGASTVQLDLLNRLSSAGFGQRPRGDREEREQFAQTISAAFSELNDRLQDLSAGVKDLNQRTLSQLTRMIPEPGARDLKTRYYDRAYPGVPVGRGEAGRRLDEIARMDALSDEQIEQIDGIKNSFLSSLDHLTQQMIDLTDKNPERGGMRFRIESPGQENEVDEFTEKMDGYREQRTALIDRTINDLNRVLGEELTQQLDRRVAKASEDEETTGEMQIVAMAVEGGSGGGGGVGEFQTLTITASGNLNSLTEDGDEETHDQYLPGPITTRDLDRYAEYLGIGEDMRSVLDGIHDDYRDQFKQLQDTRIKSVREKSRSLWAVDEASGEVNAPDRKDIEDLYALRRSVLKDIEGVDDAFFANIETVLLDDDQATRMQRVRLARKRSIYSRGRDTGGFRMFGGPGGGGRRAMSFLTLGAGSTSESIVDVSGLVGELSLDETERRNIDYILADYERDVTAQFQTAYETDMRFSEAMEAMQAESTTVDESGNREVRMRAGGGMRDLMEGDGQLREETRRSIIELNRKTLDALERVLPGEYMTLLRDSYNRQSFPDVYNDSYAATHLLDAVANLPDLATSQRLQLDEIALDYRTEYDALCLQMVEMKRAAPAEGGMFGGRGGRNVDIQAFQQRQRDMERVRFERKDLSDKTRNRLKAVLNEDQIARLADLFEAREEGNFIRIGG